MITITIRADEAGQRLDKYLAKYLDKAPKSFIYKSLRKKNIKLDSRKADGSELLKEGDEIRLFFADDTFRTLCSRAAEQGDGGVTGIPADSGEIRGIKTAIGATESENRKYASFVDSAIHLKDYCEIIYEDQQVIIANKHAGVLSQKAKASDISINEVLLQYVKEQKVTSESAVSTFTPSVCNRLDRNTSGLVCFAKTYGAAREWNRLFYERDMKKYYLALVQGSVTKAFRESAWLYKDEKRNQVRILDHPEEGAVGIETAFEPADLSDLHAAGAVRIPEGYTLLKVELITGKSHQIRAHLSHLGHPIAGDPKYADPLETARLRRDHSIRRQLLHAYELQLPEDVRQPMEHLQGRCFHAPLPSDMLFKKQ